MHPGEGDEELSESSKDGPRPAGGRSKPGARQTGKKQAAKSKASSEVGRALRSVYDSTLREEVPSEFLDLLGKLD